MKEMLWRGRIVVFLISQAGLYGAQSLAANDRIVVPEGTAVKLKLLEAVSSRTAKVGDPVALEVVEDLRVNGTVVVPTGAKAKGEITAAKKAGMMGKAGDLALRPYYVRAGDIRIELRGTKIAEGDSKVGKAILLTAISGLGVLKRGQNIEIPEGTPLTAFVTEDTSVPIAALPVTPPPISTAPSAPSPSAPSPRPTTDLASSSHVDAPPGASDNLSSRSRAADNSALPVVCDGLRQPRKLDRGAHDLVLPGVLFGNGNTEEIHLTNKDKKDETVTIERYAATGCMVETLDKVIPANGKAEVRLDLSQPKPGMGWLRVVAEGKAVGASTTHEVLSGNNLVSLPHNFFARNPTGRLIRVHHRWVINQSSSPAFLTLFVNLSEYAVQVGACGAPGPRYSCRTLDHTVAPMAQIAFRLNSSTRYTILESEPGYSVSTAVHFSDGEKQVFNASSVITFDETASKASDK
jgi:hypothetical protein